MCPCHSGASPRTEEPACGSEMGDGWAEVRGEWEEEESEDVVGWQKKKCGTFTKGAWKETLEIKLITR